MHAHILKTRLSSVCKAMPRKNLKKIKIICPKETKEVYRAIECESTFY